MTAPAPEFTLGMDAWQMQIVADGLAMAYFDQQSWRDRCAEAAKRRDKNDLWVKVSRSHAQAADQKMAQIDTLVATLPEFGRRAYAAALTFHEHRATA